MASSAGPGGGPQLLPEVKGAAAVAVWLAELGYTRLQSVFAGQNVDALSLSELSDIDLSLLGISNARDRTKLFSRAKAFLAQGASSRRQAVSAPPAPAQPLAVSGALVPLDPKAQPNVVVNANISALLAHPADPALNAQAALEATQVQIDAFLSQLATRIGWHLWEIDLRCAPGLPPGWDANGVSD